MPLQHGQRLRLPLGECSVLRVHQQLVRIRARPRVAPDAPAVHLAPRPLERLLECVGQRLIKSVVAEQHSSVRRRDPAAAVRRQLLRQLLDVVGEHRPLVQPDPGLPPGREPAPVKAPVPVPGLLALRHRPQQLHQALRLAVVRRHQARIRLAQRAVDDRVDHGVERQVPCRRQRPLHARVPQQHVQELVTQHRLHVLRRAAVLLDEAEVDRAAAAVPPPSPRASARSP